MMAQQHNFNGGKQMDKNTILNYVTETPGNTNRAVLGSMLDSISNDGSTPLIVNININSEGYVLDKTFGEIRTAYEAGRVVKLVSLEEGIYGNNLDVYFISSIIYHNQDGVNPLSYGYVFYIDSSNTIIKFSATTIESAPSLEDLDALYPARSF